MRGFSLLPLAAAVRTVHEVAVGPPGGAALLWQEASRRGQKWERTLEGRDDRDADEGGDLDDDDDGDNLVGNAYERVQGYMDRADGLLYGTAAAAKESVFRAAKKVTTREPRRLPEPTKISALTDGAKGLKQMKEERKRSDKVAHEARVAIDTASGKVGIEAELASAAKQEQGRTHAPKLPPLPQELDDAEVVCDACQEHLFARDKRNERCFGNCARLCSHWQPTKVHVAAKMTKDWVLQGGHKKKKEGGDWAESWFECCDVLDCPA